MRNENMGSKPESVRLYSSSVSKGIVWLCDNAFSKLLVNYHPGGEGLVNAVQDGDQGLQVYCCQDLQEVV